MDYISKWRELLKEELTKEYYINLIKFLDQEYKESVIFPPREEIFNCFRYTDPDNLKVVILGQDPYHEKGQAMGLAFSVRQGVKIPPSLRNIYKEIREDLGINPPDHGDLTYIAKQGVLLLNTVLTVREGMAHSHKNKGWEIFTDAVIEMLGKRGNLVFMLWGNPAQKKANLIKSSENLILTAAHPSPLSANRGFLGCKHFSKSNQYLISRNITPIFY